MTTTPKLGTKDLLKAQRWAVERELNLLPLLYKLNSLTPIPSIPWHVWDSNPDLSLQNRVFLTPLLSFIFEKEKLAILDWKRKKNDPTDLIIFLEYYICGDKQKIEMGKGKSAS